jgi:hypothetical protein
MIDPKPVEQRHTTARIGRYVVAALFLLGAAAAAYTYYQPPAHLSLGFVTALIDYQIR